MKRLKKMEIHNSVYRYFFQVAHPLIQSSLLQFIHSGFFVSVLGFALTKVSIAFSTVQLVT